MATTYKKISDMTAASALDGTELFEAVQSSNSVQVTGAQLLAYVTTEGSEATGEYVQFGTYQFCWTKTVNASGATSTWTFPTAFSTAGSLVVGGQYMGGAGTNVRVSIGTVSTTVVTFGAIVAHTGDFSAVSQDVGLWAFGYK